MKLIGPAGTELRLYTLCALVTLTFDHF